MATARKKPASKSTTRKATVRKSPDRQAPVAKAAPALVPPLVAAPKPGKNDKADKAKKPKLVRDSFTIPKNEYGVIEVLKARAARLGRPAKKSEVLRAGVMALDAMTDSAFLACIGGVPAVKTGRPAKA